MNSTTKIIFLREKEGSIFIESAKPWIDKYFILLLFLLLPFFFRALNWTLRRKQRCLRGLNPKVDRETFMEEKTHIFFLWNENPLISRQQVRTFFLFGKKRIKYWRMWESISLIITFLAHETHFFLSFKRELSVCVFASRAYAQIIHLKWETLALISLEWKKKKDFLTLTSAAISPNAITELWQPPKRQWILVFQKGTKNPQASQCI